MNNQVESRRQVWALGLLMFVAKNDPFLITTKNRK